MVHYQLLLLDDATCAAPYQVACMPADVVKTRLQNGQHRYDGVLQCCLAGRLQEWRGALRDRNPTRRDDGGRFDSSAMLSQS